MRKKLSIEFDHNFTKLANQAKLATLIYVQKLTPSQISHEFVRYDTAYRSGLFCCFFEYYPLDIKKGNRYIYLVFLGENKIPFSTLRKYTYSKMSFYKRNVGKNFKLIVGGKI